MGSPYSNRRKWTSGEDMQLRNLRSRGVEYREIAGLLGRGTSGVRKRAADLGICRPAVRRSSESSGMRGRRLKRVNMDYLADVPSLPDSLLRDINSNRPLSADQQREGQQAIAIACSHLRAARLKRPELALDDSDFEFESDWEEVA